MKVKFLLLAIAAVANGKYGSLWIDDDEDTCALQLSAAPVADDIMLLYEKASKKDKQQPQALVE